MIGSLLEAVGTDDVAVWTVDLTMAEAVGSARTCTAFCTVALMMDSASIALYPCATDLLSLTFNIFDILQAFFYSQIFSLVLNYSN